MKQCDKREVFLLIQNIYELDFSLKCERKAAESQPLIDACCKTEQRSFTAEVLKVGRCLKKIIKIQEMNSSPAVMIRTLRCLMHYHARRRADQTRVIGKVREFQTERGGLVPTMLNTCD